MNVVRDLIKEEYNKRYYDEDESLVWDNEELFQKHMSYLENRKKEGSK